MSKSIDVALAKEETARNERLRVREAEIRDRTRPAAQAAAAGSNDSK